eukprot:1159942-Pelagomonas_calceolata.AAC.13
MENQIGIENGISLKLGARAGAGLFELECCSGPPFSSHFKQCSWQTHHTGAASNSDPVASSTKGKAL